MKSSRNLKVGVILLLIVLAVGIFASFALAGGKGVNGRGNSNNGINSGIGNQQDAPDEDGDGIPNGLDSDYILHDCDEECDGICVFVPQGNGWGRNSLVE